MTVILPTLHEGRTEEECDQGDKEFASKDPETGEQIFEYSRGGQITVRDALETIRFIIIFAGRRWGKTFFAIAILLACAVTGGHAWWIWPVRDQALEAWEKLVEMVGHWDGVDSWETKKRMKFPGGGYIWVKSADRPETLRGPDLDLAVIDEAEYIKKLKQLFEEVIRPALSDREGKAVIMSSAAGFSWLHSMAAKALNMAHWKSFRFPTWYSPNVKLSELRLMEEEMDEDVFKREIACEPIGAEGAVFGNVYRLEKGNGKPPDRKKERSAGLDLARLGDYSGLSISEWNEIIKRREQLFLNRWRMMHWDDIVDEVIELLIGYNVTRLVIDSTGIGDVLAEKIVDEIEARVDYDIEIVLYVFTAKSKTRLVRSFRWALNKGIYIILNHKKLEAELQDFVGKKSTQTMHVVYEAEHGHDDLVICTMLDAWGIDIPEAALGVN